MFRGVYKHSGGSVGQLPIMQRLPEAGASPGQLEVHGPLAVGRRAHAERTTFEGIHCIFDGCLYERADLARLLGLGPTSDAELVARGYRRYGEELLQKLRGRFAFVVWDVTRQRGFLSSDLLATQPLFLWSGVGYLAFATELVDLLSMLPSKPGPDPQGFVSWLGGWTIPADHTLYEGISRLPPGNRVELAGEAHVRQYWRPRFNGTLRGSREELAEGLLGEVERAVAKRLSGSSVGVVLSGGLDSSIVTAVADRVRQPGQKLHTYSSVFPGAEYDEAWKVRSLGEALGIEPGLFELKPQGGLWLNFHYLKQWDLPLLGNSALIDVAMVEAASRDGIDVVLDGQTGDEVFGFSPWLIADRLKRGRVLAALGLARQWPGREPTGREQRHILKRWGLKGAAPYRLHRLVRSRRDPGAIAPAWLLSAFRARYAELEDQWTWKAMGTGPAWWRYQADTLVQAPHRELRLDYLRNRAAGLGVGGETPLYDFDLIDYCLRLPPEFGFDSRFSRPLARAAMNGLIPDEVRLNDKKATFSPFCYDMMIGADAPGIDRLLTAPDAELGGYADLNLIRKLWQEDRPKPGPGYATTHWGTDVWRLAAAESWLRSQSDPGFADRMLAHADVRPPSVRRMESSD